MPRLAPDSILSHYKIKELIAIGGMGEVYRAVDLQLGRVVALKTIVAMEAGNLRMNHRFMREARAASILTHPSICTIYEIGREDELTFITMQYIPGQTIQEKLSAGPIPVETALGYALDIADALDEAHGHGVIHRDIKPSNIIINKRGLAVVLDFGLATQVSFAGTLDEELSTLPDLTSTAALVGTMPYMSPEQVRSEALDGRTDIFSFGVTLYEMLSGVRPFDGPNKVDLLHAILHDKPKPLTEVRPDLEKQLTEVIDRALKKDPNERYQSAAEFKQELLTHIQEAGYVVARAPSASASGRLVASRKSGDGRLWPHRKSWSSAALIASFVGAVLVIGGIFWWLSGTRPEKAPIPHYVQIVNWKSEPGESTSDAVFSSDGQMIAFSSIRGNYRDIWIKQTTMGDPSQITKGDWNSWNPIWSADDQQIAFLSRREGQTGIWRMPAFGGSATLIKAGVNGSLQLKHWSKDGRRIYYELRPNVFALDVASGEMTQLTRFAPSSPRYPKDFSLSPAEDQIAYVDQKGEQLDIWTVPVRGGVPVQITNDDPDDSHPLWHPDGKRIIYDSIRDRSSQICVAYIDGRAPTQLTSGESDKVALDVSASGSEVLYNSSKEESGIWQVNVETAEESAITSDAGFELWPDVSPDGRMIVYQSVSDPVEELLKNSLILVRSPKNGDRAIRLATNGISPTWSPDNKTVAFLRLSGNLRNIWTVKTAEGQERQLTRLGCDSGWSTLPYNRFERKFFSWSPDGTRIIYHFQQDNNSNLSIVEADGSKENIISSSSDLTIFCPLWSLDGGRVAYVTQAMSKSDSGKRTWSIKLIDLGNNQSETVLQGESPLLLLGWNDVGGDLLVATLKGTNDFSIRATVVSLVSISTTGASRNIAELTATYIHNTLLAPDRRTIAFVSHQDGKDNISLISAKGGAPRKITFNNDPRLFFSNMAFSPDGKAIYFGKQSRSTVISMIDNFK